MSRNVSSVAFLDARIRARNGSTRPSAEHLTIPHAASSLSSPHQPPCRCPLQRTLRHSATKGMSQRSHPRHLPNTHSWELRVPKRCVLLSEMAKVRRRLQQLVPLYVHSGSAIACDGRALLVPFAEVLVSAMFVTISPDQRLVAAALGPRDAYVALPHGLDELQARPLLKRIVMTLLALHSQHVVHGHCDTDSFVLEAAKPGGHGAGRCKRRLVLVDHPIPASLLACRSAEGLHARRCAAPEVRLQESLSFAADVWSVGVLLLRLTQPLHKDLTAEDVEDTDLLSPFLTSLSGTARSLLVQCLKREPSSRPFMWEVLEHPFFRDEATDAVRVDSSDADGVEATSSSSADHSSQVPSSSSSVDSISPRHTKE